MLASLLLAFAQDRAITFHGPILGAVTESEATIWCRLNVATPVQVIYSTDPLLLSPTLSAAQTPDPSSDYCLHFPITGLTNTTHYYYALVAPSLNLPNQTPTYSFWTTPPAGEEDHSFSFLVFSDATSGDDPAFAAAYQAAAAEPATFVLQIGDLDHRNPAKQQSPPVLGSWREMHRQHLGGWTQGDALADLCRSKPLYHIWDDHDYGDNNAGGDAPWKSQAMRAFREYFPCPPLPDPADGNYYRFTYADYDFFVLDCRWNRESWDLPEPKTMLGATQLAWLQSGLLASQARWKFVVSSSCWNPLGKPNDSWAGYPTEKAAILLSCGSIPGVVVISGDIHSSGCIDDGTNSFWPEISVPATNMPHPASGCTGGQGCGTWSEGALDLGPPAGYARVDVTPTSVTLLCMDSSGTVVLSYTVQ